MVRGRSQSAVAIPGSAHQSPSFRGAKGELFYIEFTKYTVFIGAYGIFTTFS